MTYIRIKVIIRGFKLGIQHEINHTYKYEFSVDHREEIIDKVKELLKEDGICVLNNLQVKSIKILPSCSACREDQPNQLAHMDYGGCMYDSSQDT